MNKKTLFQILLFSIAILIFIGILKLYYKENKVEEENYNINSDNINEITNNFSSTNLINNIKYLSKDKEGNEYEIKSDYGEIDLNNTDIIFMTKVTATIKSKNYSIIKISSDFSKYNTNTYETNFSENVLLVYEEHKINSNNLDLSIENNLVTFFDSIIYRNKNTKLIADRLEIDLITKNSKIFMNENIKKIKILSKK